METTAAATTKILKGTIPFTDLSFAMDDLNKEIVLGTGTFGIVYKGFYSGYTVAIKKLREELLTADIIKEFLKEVMAMQKAVNPNIACCYGSSVYKNTPYIIMEYLSMGSLRSLLNKGCHLALMSDLLNNDPNKAEHGKLYLSEDGKYYVRKEPKGVVNEGKINPEEINLKDLSNRLKDEDLKSAILEITSKREHTYPEAAEITWPFRLGIAIDMIEGLYYLHLKRILHRDIKADNILITTEGRAKLSDFGLACQSNSINENLASINSGVLGAAGEGEAGTFPWMAPEIFVEYPRIYSEKSDIYAYAITLWEMANHAKPFPNLEIVQLLRKIEKGERPQLTVSIPDEYAYYKSIMEASWKQNLEKRPSAKEIKKHFKSEMAALIQKEKQNVGVAYKSAMPSNTTTTTTTVVESNKATEAKLAEALAAQKQLEEKLAAIEAKAQQEAEAAKAVKEKAEKLAEEKAKQEIEAANAAKEKAEKELAELRAKAKQDAESAKIKIQQQAKALAAKEKTEKLAAQKATSTAVKVDPQEVSKFLRLVAEGEQDQAEAMLKQNKNLSLAAGNVTDLSGRTFNNITGFQYAVWALDSHMWKMILSTYLPIEAAREQIKGLDTGSWVNQHGKSASWQNLIDSLDEFIKLCNESKWGEASTQWNKNVGNAQQQLPVHVVNQYCHPSRSFYPCPNFNDQSPLPRSRRTDEGDWFTCTYNGGKIGANRFAFVRGSRTSAREVGWGESVRGGTGRGVCEDHMALVTYLRHQIQKRNQLFAEVSVTFTLDHKTRYPHKLFTELLYLTFGPVGLGRPPNQLFAELLDFTFGPVGLDHQTQNENVNSENCRIM